MTQSPSLVEIVQNKIQLFKENQFVESAKELGVSDYEIIFKHILWYNCKALIFIQLTYQVSEVILLEASLSYLGFGPKGGDQMSWGYMVANGMAYINKNELSFKFIVVGLDLMTSF